MKLPLAIIPGVTGGWELLLILALVLLLFGPKRLPEIAEAMGKSIRKFKSATQSATDEVKREPINTRDRVRPANKLRDLFEQVSQSRSFGHQHRSETHRVLPGGRNFH